MTQNKSRGSARQPRRGSGKKSKDVQTGRLRVHDPFELIRWLALSQPDPRKALAELVQNSLDAQARKIVVTRRREKRVPTLRIWDDGEGVIPEMERREALTYIATHIGHSRKRTLTPQQRLELMTQGQYGIGLLGFWALGDLLEMRSSVPGQKPLRLVLYRDRPDYLIEPLRGRLPLEEAWTEVVIRGVHREALPVLAARRAADHLAFELRGQLLAREVDLTIHDHIARGLAAKHVRVQPRRFLGEKLAGFDPVPVPGHPPIQLELYLSGEDDEGGSSQGIAVFAGGTLVAESFRDLTALELDHAPWTDARLTGMVDYPGFQVAPGSRRGIVPDAAAGAFAAAILRVEPRLQELLESFERRRAEKLDRALIRDLQHAFRDFYRQRPAYSMLPVREHAGGAPDGAEPEPGISAAAAETEAGTGEAAEAEQPFESEPPVDLLPAGPLAEVVLRPAQVRVECGESRGLRARALDASGRPIERAVQYHWSLAGPVGSLAPVEGSPERALLTAAAEPATGSVRVEAISDGARVAAEAPVAVLDVLPPPRSHEGIPRPDLMDAPGAPWRSRMLDGRWQVNSGHADFRAIAHRPALKLRYLAFLFAKEVVLRSRQDPRLESALEALVEVAAYADRELTARRGGRPPKRRER